MSFTWIPHISMYMTTGRYTYSNKVLTSLCKSHIHKWLIVMLAGLGACPQQFVLRLCLYSPQYYQFASRHGSIYVYACILWHLCNLQEVFLLTKQGFF